MINTLITKIKPPNIGNNYLELTMIKTSDGQSYGQHSKSQVAGQHSKSQASSTSFFFFIVEFERMLYLLGHCNISHGYIITLLHLNYS